MCICNGVSREDWCVSWCSELGRYTLNIYGHHTTDWEQGRKEGSMGELSLSLFQGCSSLVCLFQHFWSRVKTSSFPRSGNLVGVKITLSVYFWIERTWTQHAPGFPVFRQPLMELLRLPQLNPTKAPTHTCVSVYIPILVLSIWKTLISNIYCSTLGRKGKWGHPVYHAPSYWFIMLVLLWPRIPGSYASMGNVT